MWMWYHAQWAVLSMKESERSQLITADSVTKSYHISTTRSLPTARGNRAAGFCKRQPYHRLLLAGKGPEVCIPKWRWTSKFSWVTEKEIWLKSVDSHACASHNAIQTCCAGSMVYFGGGDVAPKHVLNLFWTLTEVLSPLDGKKDPLNSLYIIDII